MSARIFGAAALVFALAQAANVNVHNNCNFAVKATPSSEGTDDSPEYVQPGKTFTRPAAGAAWCLKLYGPGANGQQWASSPTQLEWSVWEPSPGNSILSYDLSNIDMGDATTFLQHGMNLTSEDPTCDNPSSTCRPAVCKAQGLGQTTQCEDAYNQPFDVRTLGASSSYDINMVLCTANQQVSSGSSSAPSSGSNSPSPASSYNAPASQTTLATSAAAAPSVTAVQENSAGNVYEESNGNVVTEYVVNTAVVTNYVTQAVAAREAEPTLVKRFAHPHGHGNRHNRA